MLSPAQPAASPPPSQTKQHNAYLSSYAPSTTTHHEWRNATNSAAHLLPHLTSLVATKPDIKLLDIGAGSGTITASLAAYLPQGTVIATDISDKILEQAKWYAESAGVNNVKVQKADVYSLPFDDDDFDVVHASMILAHLDDPRGAVEEMVRVTKKPGGILSLRESDLRMWSIYPELPPLLAFNKMFCAVHAANGAQVDAGAQLVSWLLAAGVHRLKILASAGTWCYSNLEERRLWGGRMREACVGDQVRMKALELGIVTQDELVEMSEAWEEWIEAADGWFGCMHGEVIVKL